MIAKRIIPCLDIEGGRVVKGVNFVNLVDAGNPVEIAKAYNDAGADELVILDISATNEERKTLMELVKVIAQEVFIPLTVGGGIRTVADFQEALRSGADKVSINSAAVKNPQLITDCGRKFGRQAVVVAMDVKKSQGGTYHVYIKGGRENTGLEALSWAKEVEALGAGEILLTSMDRDGTKMGYDLEITEIISRGVNIPVIASGGAGSKEDFYKVFTKGWADGALAASLFHYREIEIQELKDFLHENNVKVRR